MRMLILSYDGFKYHNVVSVGKDSYIYEQCGQQLALNASRSKSKILALHQTELYMPNLWTAIIVFGNISFFKKMYSRLVFWWRNRLSFTPKRNLLQEITVITINPFIRSWFRRKCPFRQHICNSDQSARCSLVQNGVHSIHWSGQWYKTLIHE